MHLGIILPNFDRHAAPESVMDIDFRTRGRRADEALRLMTFA